MKFKVLLIDDEPSALEGLQLWIDWEELGFEICGTSSNGVEGLKLIHQLEPDLVITDVNMPLMNGLDMIAAWKQEKVKDIKFAILSGYSEFEYAQTAIRYGINHYLLKPIIAEEAEEELKEIYLELEQDLQKQNLNQRATSEQVVTLIKGLLNEKPEVETDLTVLTELSAGRLDWNFCLIQTVPGIYAELRGRTASIVADKSSMFLMDLELSSFGIVYGRSSSDSSENTNLNYALNQLQQMYPKDQLSIARGASVKSLSNILNSYRTAKEALMHYFYNPGTSGILSYQDIHHKPFSYHYDQMLLMDDMIRPINLLDRTGFIQAVDSAAASFREMRIAPEIVKKIVIHLVYKIIEYTREAGDVQVASLLTKFRIPEIFDSMITLDALMINLLACGEECIHTLLLEQTKRSQGIVQQINDYIEEHYREGLTIKKLAEVFFMHPVYLGQLLMKKNGIHFNEQLHNLRIQEAERLLQLNKLKNSEIAEEVGYSNYGQFLKQFEKKMQMCPNEYKNIKT
ncbi:response regulator transcription factor [Paenibacillus wynnii]|uniref:AraC family transcriptional regulator n=1 Tax=Paenibacillus wynnii TaxID=268407 RepID=A0A098MAL8_9BACL|nr:response regulator [Paenibacillus wynnii]KGE19106.1 AraC family transcriptional regulator [Paenibacillus wynnii]